MNGRRTAWLVLRLIALGVLGYVGFQVIEANSAELSGAATYLEHANWLWVILASAAEAAAYLNTTLLQRRLLGAGGVTVGLTPLAAMSLAGNAIANTLPGGGAFATVFAYRQYRQRGADDALTTWTVVAFTVVTSVTLAVLAVLGLVIAGSDSGVAGLWLLVALLMVAPVGGMAVLLWPRHAAKPIRPIARRSPWGDPSTWIEQMVTHLETVRPRLRDWGFALVFAAGNWVTDCLCLVLSYFAVGGRVPWRGLLVAYGAAQVAASVPITPGGLGVVEGSLTVALVAFGGSTAETVAAVLLYRIISFWVMVPVGWVAWLGLHITQRGDAVKVEMA